MAGLPVTNSYESYGRNGVPFLDASLYRAKQITVKEPSNRPNFHPASFAQGRATGMLRTLSQITPQTFTKEVAQSMAMNGINSTEARKDSGMLNTKVVAEAVGMHTNITVTTTTHSQGRRQRRKKCSEERRNAMLLNEGIPCEEARKMLINNPQKRSNLEDPPGPPIKILKMPTRIDKQDLRPAKDERPLRVGITNSKPMSEDEMKMLHRHLIIAITELCPKGGGPEFLGFSHKSSWVLVTCVNQRSKDWLVHEVPYLKPWPGAQLSIIPDQELPKPPTASVLIPVSEAPSLEEAIHLLKAQNKGLNTELWKVRSEKVKLEMEGRLLCFDIDDPSADALRALNCQAAIGFKMVTFKIKGQYRPYTPLSATQNQVPATPTRRAMPDSSSKPDQARATVTSKEVPLSAARGKLPHAASSERLTIQRQDIQCSAENTFAHGSGGITSLKEPAALAAVGRSMPQSRGEFGRRPVTQYSQGHGSTFAQEDQERPVIGRLLSLARGLAPRTARDAAQSIIQESQSGTPLTQDRYGADRTVFGSDKSVLAKTKGRSQRGDSPSHIGASFYHDRAGASTINPDKYSFQAPGEMYRARNNSPTAFPFNKSKETARDLPKGGFGARSNFQGSLSGKTLFTQFGGTTFGHVTEAARTVSDHGSTLTTNPVPRGQVEAQIIQDPQSHGDEAFDQGRTEIYLPVSDPDEPLARGLSPEAEGGYHTWIIEDLESYGDRLSQEPVVTGALTSAIEPSPLARDYSNQCHSNQFDQYSRTTANQEMTLDRGQGRDGYGAWIIGPESHESLQGSRTVTREPRLLPHPSGCESPTIESDSRIRPFQGHSGTDRERELDRGVSHEARDRFGERTHTESHGRYQDGRISHRESRSRRRPLPNPRGYESRTVKPESNGRPFHGSRGLADQDPRSHRLSQASYEDRIQDPGHERTSDQESRSDRRLSPHGRSSAWTIEESHRSRTKDWDGSTARPRSREVLDKRASVGVSHSSGGSRLKPRHVARESWRVREGERVKRSDIRPRQS